MSVSVLSLFAVGPRLKELCVGDTARVSCETLGAATRAALEGTGRYLGQAAAAVVLTLHPDLILGGESGGIGRSAD